MMPVIPVVLFAYARPDHLVQTLSGLQQNNVPLIYAFADGAKTPDILPRVSAVREILHQIDWCEMHIVERNENLGLGKSILMGMDEVFQKFESAIVFEDDLICVPGTYQYLCAALEYYEDDPIVMSVTGWTHPLVTPSTVVNQPYFDGRAESWSWGSWSRAWNGMKDTNALSLVNACIKKQKDVYRYGADLFQMAKVESKNNIWAVRFAYLHMFNGGLCLRPPRGMVNHLGFDELGTNVTGPSDLSLSKLEKAPEIPEVWPPSVENPECAGLWQKRYGQKPTLLRKLKGLFRDSLLRLRLFLLMKIAKPLMIQIRDLLHRKNT